MKNWVETKKKNYNKGGWTVRVLASKQTLLYQISDKAKINATTKNEAKVTKNYKNDNNEK